jgi:signal transduction histidine kinase
MKRIIISAGLVFNIFLVNAQQQTINDLRYKITIAANENEKENIRDSLAMYYLFFTKKTDSSFYFINESINKAFNLKDNQFLILAYQRLGFYYVCTSQLKAAIEISLKGIKLSDDYGIKSYLSGLYYNLSWVYANLGNINFQLRYGYKAIPYLQDSKDSFMDQSIHVFGAISAAYLFSKKPDSSFYFLEKMRFHLKTSKELIAKDVYQWYLGMYYLGTLRFAKADSVLKEGTARCEAINDLQLLQAFYSTQAHSLMAQGKLKEAIPILHHNFHVSASTKDRQILKNAAMSLYSCYNKLGIFDSAFYYLKLSDSLQTISNKVSNSNEVQQIAFETQLNQKENEANQALQNVKSRNKMTVYVFLTALVFFLILAIIQWHNNKQKKKANLLLQLQKEKVESTLLELKATQTQLIQSEKMASLGELTAGIAHEIQNPLNFVNNFSEVNKELVDELQNELKAGSIDNAFSISNDIKDNEEKINHHGKRADAIVKGMLQHSRATTGKKEQTDINALADEYLRLAYHGLRAKDKDFNATIKTDFDNSIGKITAVPQDIGRVLLNLYNNAFYAVAEKQKQSPHPLRGGEEVYKPVVTVSTKRLDSPLGNGGKIEIRVIDNGNGIPEKVLDKIFQPFFTTKPTGQGTGLGLSLSYDIIKAHGGEIKVNTKEGDGSEFIIQLRTN